VLWLYIINSLEVEGAGVSPSECPAYLAPALCMFGLLSVVFLAGHENQRHGSRGPVQQATSPRFTFQDCLAPSKRRMKLSFVGKWMEIILLNEKSPAQMANRACSCSYMESTSKMIMTIMVTHECKAGTV
jgi:hypothetical protein